MERDVNPKSITRLFYLQKKEELLGTTLYGVPICDRSCLDFWSNFTEKSLFTSEDEVYDFWKRYPECELTTFEIKNEIEVKKYSHHSGVDGRYGIVCEKCGIIADDHGRWEYQCSYYSEQ